MNSQNIVFILLGACFLIGVFFLLSGDKNKNLVKQRIKSLRKDKNINLKAELRSVSNAPAQKRKQLLKALKDHESQEKKIKFGLSFRLLQAGLQFNPTQFWIFSAILGGVSLVITLILRLPLWVDLIVVLIAGLGFPQWVLGFLINRRINKFTLQFPDGLDIIIRGVRSGLPPQECMRLIGTDSPDPLGEEFRRLTENMSIGLPLEDVLEKFYVRVPSPDVRFFMIVLTIQRKIGGNLAEALNNLSDVLRARKFLKEKIKTLSSEAIGGACVVGALPPGLCIILSFLNPEFLTPLFQEEKGHFFLGLAIGLEILGGFVMYMMTRIKV